MVANGTVGQPIVFTSYRDDSVLGDSNADGMTSPHAEDWGGIYFWSTSQNSSIIHARIRYGGESYNAVDCAVRVTSADVLIAHTDFENNHEAICVLASGAPDLGGGVLGSPGGNRFFGHTTGSGNWAVYNASTNNIAAIGNWWGYTSSQLIDGVIYDKNDDPSRGLVVYESYMNCVAGLPCDDGDSCTYDDYCSSGNCTGTAYACDAPGACEIAIGATCDGNGSCAYLADLGADCDDENACTYSDSCQADKSCMGEAYSCTTPGPCETADGAACDGAGGCLYLPTTGAQCDDGDTCTHSDTCQADKACAGTPYFCDSPGACETTEGANCDGAGGCSYPADVGGGCDDDDACTHSDWCQANKACVGTPYTCNSPGSCESEIGAACDGNGGCVYQADTGAQCDDADSCTHSDLCQESKDCVGTSFACEAPAACETVEGATCDGLGGCTYPVDAGAVCDDGDTCTHSDACQADKACVGTPYFCDSPGACETAEGANCDGAGGCSYVADVGGVCDDNNSCTHSDSCQADKACVGTPYTCDSPGLCESEVGAACDGNGGCVYQADTGTQCDDADSCTHSDLCQESKDCAGTPYACETPAACETTDGATCDGLGGCSYPADTGVQCDDGDTCSHSDACQEDKVCVGIPYTCDSPGQCESEKNATCDGDGSCTYQITSGEECDDDEVCTLSDTCHDDGTCTGEAYACDDPSQCETSDEAACNGDGTCSYPVLEGAVCDDDDSCTHSDVCQSGGECLGTPYPCETPGQCEAAEGAMCGGDGTCIYNTLEGAACDDGNACTYDDLCVGSACIGAPSQETDCDDQNVCTDDYCEPDSGCFNTPNAAPCDDGNICTQNSCEAGVCVVLEATTGCCTLDTDCEAPEEKCDTDNNQCVMPACLACQDNSECGASGNQCTSFPSGDYCTVQCAGDNTCLEDGYECAHSLSPPQCLPTQGDCQCIPESAVACSQGQLVFFDTCENAGDIVDECGVRGCIGDSCCPFGWYQEGEACVEETVEPSPESDVLDVIGSLLEVVEGTSMQEGDLMVADDGADLPGASSKSGGCAVQADVSGGASIWFLLFLFGLAVLTLRSRRQNQTE